MEEYVNLFVMKYGYAGIFFSLSLGIIGLPIPDEVLMTYAGYAAAHGLHGQARFSARRWALRSVTELAEDGGFLFSSRLGRTCASLRRN